MYGSMRISIGMEGKLILTELIACATLTAIDGDTPSAMGKTCDCWGKAFHSSAASTRRRSGATQSVSRTGNWR